MIYYAKDLKCGDIGDKHRLFDLRGSEATLDNCKEKCKNAPLCKAFSMQSNMRYYRRYIDSRTMEQAGGAFVRQLLGHEDRVYSVDYSSDGRFVVSGSHDSTVRIWDVDTGECVYQPT